MIKAAWYMIAALGLIAFSACSGGGGGGGGGNTVTQPTTATLKISTQGTVTPDGTKIGGIDLTLTLPSGVTVKSTADSPSSKLVTSDGVVTISGVATVASTTDRKISLATYTPAASSTAGKVDVKVVNAEGFGTGEFVTIKCDIAAGSHPTSADFNNKLNKVVDLNGANILGLTPTYTAEIK